MTAWSTVAALPAVRCMGGAVAVGGFVYYLGGSTYPGVDSTVATVYRYDPTANTWTTRAPLLTGVSLAAYGSDPSGRIIVAGGYSVAGSQRSTAVRYDPGADAWTTIASLPQATTDCASCTDSQGRMYVIGGATNGGTTQAVYRWNPTASAWDTLASLPSPRYQAAAAVDAQDRVYVAGGFQSGQANNNIAPLLRYDPTTNAWTQLASPSSQHRNGPAVLSESNGRVYLISGASAASGSTVTVDVAERFDPAAATWSTITSIPGPRVYSTAARVGGALYVIGGAVDVGSSTATNTVQRDNENTAPNAGSKPTGDGTSFDRTAVYSQSYTFSDPDAGDQPSKTDWRWRTSPTTGSPGAWNTTTVTGNSTSITWAANTFPAGRIEVQDLPYDSQGVVAPAWSDSAFLTAANPPAAPTFSAPAAGSTIATSSVTATIVADTLDAHQWRVMGDTGGSANSTVIVAGTTIEDPTSRQFTATGLPNGTTVHLQDRRRVNGLWSTWADNGAQPVSYTPPPAATMTLTPQPAAAKLTVGWSIPTPSGSQPAVSTVDVYVDDATAEGLHRKPTAVDLPPATTTWVHDTPVLGREYGAGTGRVRVVVKGANGTTATTSS